MAVTRLRTDEAVLLAHVLVHHLAQVSGVRVLFIKGPAAVELGARPPRPSADVDALVAPGDFRSMCDALEAASWLRRSPRSMLTHATDLAFDHSAHFIHPEWPCDIDLHYNFPGFLAAPAAVFEELWADQVLVDIAGHPVASPAFEGQALIVALHVLRDGPRPSNDDLQFVATEMRRRGPDSIARLQELARATGSLQTAEAFLDLVGAAVPGERHSSAAAAWAFRQEHAAAAGVIWVVELRRARGRERLTVLRRMVLPPASYLVGSHRAARLSRSKLTSLHIRRWIRGAKAAPKALRRGLKAPRA